MTIPFSVKVKSRAAIGAAFYFVRLTFWVDCKTIKTVISFVPSRFVNHLRRLLL